MNDFLHPSQCANQLAALAAAERIKIIGFLREGPRNVGELAALLKTAPVNVAHHTKVLKQAGMICANRQGRFIYYSLAPGLVQNDEALGKEYIDLGCCRLEIHEDEEEGPKDCCSEPTLEN